MKNLEEKNHGINFCGYHSFCVIRKIYLHSVGTKYQNKILLNIPAKNFFPYIYYKLTKSSFFLGFLVLTKVENISWNFSLS